MSTLDRVMLMNVKDETMEDNELNINLVVRRLMGAQVKGDYDPSYFVP